jgi:hypothetical protein
MRTAKLRTAIAVDKQIAEADEMNLRANCAAKDIVSPLLICVPTDPREKPDAGLTGEMIGQAQKYQFKI